MSVQVGVGLPRGCGSSKGMWVCPGGVCPGGCLPRGFSPPLHGQTNTWENITFPQLLLRTVKTLIFIWKTIYPESNATCFSCALWNLKNVSALWNLH